MTDKPAAATGYAGGYTHLVRATCLYVATKLGDLMDHLVVWIIWSWSAAWSRRC